MEPETNNESTQPAEAPVVGEEKEEGNEVTEDRSEYRTFAILGYVIPLLFFLPLLNDKTKNVPYVRFHANQQLILLILAFAIYFLHSFLYMTFMSLGLMIAQLLNLAILALAIIGIIHAYKNEMKELPFVGHFRILK